MPSCVQPWSNIPLACHDGAASVDCLIILQLPFTPCIVACVCHIVWLVCCLLVPNISYLDLLRLSVRSFVIGSNKRGLKESRILLMHENG